MSEPASTDLDDLQDQIQLNEVLIKSIEGEDSQTAADTREHVTKRLKELNAQLKAMQSSQSLPFWGSSDAGQSSAYVQSVTDDGSRPASSNPSQSAMADAMVMNSLNGAQLPNRKRNRSSGEEDLHTTQSRRPTPTAFPAAASALDPFDDDYYLDDPELSKIFGLGWQDAEQARKEQVQRLERMERVRIQEEEDRAFAKQLEEQWNQDLKILPEQKPTFAPASYSQSFMTPDGSWQKPCKPSLPKVENAFKPAIKSESKPGCLGPTVSAPLIDSGSELEEISPSEWKQQFGAVPSASNRIPKIETSQHYTMPGTFPSFPVNAYASAPGLSVYNNPSLAASGSSIDWDSGRYQQDYLKEALNMLGSMNMPFDLDSYPSPVNSPRFVPFAEPAQAQEEIKDLLKHIRPDEELTEEQMREVQPEGLKIDLMPHQRKGFAWMKSMEEGSNKGGILGDDMGLGKTVQALSLILARKPEPGVNRPTLVVAPVALMQQWEREIKKFVKPAHALNVLILHQENRNRPWNYIRTYDVVLTTYGTLASEFKRKLTWDEHLKAVPDAKPKPQQELPLLGERSYFHRIILDEAQNIKNRQTKAAVAACRLTADYRWCLSGTPMQNNVDEIYSLIKFCRIRPYHDWNRFSHDIGRPLKRTTDWGKEKAMKQLQAILKALCLRRTKASKIDGQPILQLPEKRIVEDRAIFSKDEQEFYKQLEAQAQIQFNRFLKNGTVGRYYSHALVLLLRLRQCCCSPQLVTNAKEFMTAGVVPEEDRIGNAGTLPKEVIRRLDDNDVFECPICIDAVENPIIFNPCGHTLCNECLAAMTDKAMNDTSAVLNCPHCRAVVDPHKITDLESFMRVHHPDREGVRPLGAEDEEQDNSDTDSESSNDDDVESDVDDDGEDLKDFIVKDEDALEYDTDASEGKKKPSKVKTSVSAESKEDIKHQIKSKKAKEQKPKGKSKRKGKAKAKSKKFASLAELRKEGLKNKSAKKRYLKRLEKGFEMSAKIEKTIEILQEIRSHGMGEKTIVFSSFTSFLDLLEVPLNKDEDLSNYVRYDGSMKASDRNDAVIHFTDDPRCKVILVSLKAGNAGLNLTAANHVIILDPFWNPFVEYQAADRCYRIGQKREVTIHRVLIGGDQPDDTNNPQQQQPYSTVEDRILRLQEKKKTLVETALDENAATSLGRLTTRDLGYLFGVNTMD